MPGLEAVAGLKREFYWRETQHSPSLFYYARLRYASVQYVAGALTSAMLV
jgi:hypothetical protein